MAVTPTQVDYSRRDYESFRNGMISLIPTKTPEWTDQSESDMGMVLLELLADGLDVLDYYMNRMANEAFLPTAKTRRSVIKLCALIGYTLKNATPSKVNVTLNFSAPTTGVVIPKGFQVGTKRTGTERSIIFECDQAVEVPDGSTSITASFVQGSSVYNHTLGSGNNEADQSFPINDGPVIVDDSLVVWVKEGSVWNVWTKVDDFIYSKPGDRHYTVFVDENDVTYITFGNGSNGSKVPVGASNVRLDYRKGGGTIGNVGANMITQVISGGVTGITSVTNVEPHIRGTDKETIESAKKNAPRLFRTRDTLVTLKDFEDFATFYTGVSKAQAVEDVDKNVVVYIHTEGGGMPTTALKSSLLAAINEKRILTVGATVANPTYDTVSVKLQVHVSTNYKASDVALTVDGSVRDYFTSLTFATPVLLGDLYREVMTVPGVANVVIKKADDTPFADVTVANGHFAQLGALTITTVGGS